MAEAPAEKSLEILSQEITCSACRRHYDTPKALPCCHYFCESCVRGLADNEFAAATGQQIACPECGRLAALPPGGVSHLPDVYFVKRLKELHTRMAMIQRKIEANCELCSMEKAQSFCHQCAEFMCDECAKSHSKMTKKYPGHRVAALDQLQESGARSIPMKPAPPSKCACAGHDGLCKMFCYDCRKLVCGDCSVSSHGTHRTELVKKCASQCRQSLQQNLFPLRIISQKLTESLQQIESTKSDISSQSDHVAQSIQTFFEEVISLLEREKQSLLAQSADIVQRKLASLREQETRLRAAGSSVQKVIEYCKQSAELVSDEDLLVLHQQLRDRVEEECLQYENEAEQRPCEDADVAVRVSGGEEVVELCRKKAQIYLFPMSSSGQVHLAEVGEETVHRVTDPSDLLHIPGLFSMQASLTSLVDGSTVPGEVTQVGKGLYEVRYTPRTRGRHQLWIRRDGSQIPNSPFPVFATISPSLLGPPLHTMEGLRHPYSAVFGTRNQLYVSESGGHCIQKFWRNGDRVDVESFTSQRPKCPTGLTVDGDGYIYAVNTSTHTLNKFDAKGKMIVEVGRQGSDGEEFNHPSGIAVIGDKVYVCDRNNGRIQVYSKDLELVSTFGSHGSEEGQMNWPYDLTEDGSEHIYVADCDNHRVQVFDRDGQFLSTFGSCGAEPGCLRRPTGICMGRNRLLYVTEYTNHRVSVFHTDGTYVGSFGSYGNKRGEFCYPVGITMDRDGFVYVCDQGNNRVQVF